ncbi:hypothetical protein O6H91_20G026200 [Diphasiastrum complanatum]|uniref:Uncharacterized protein n=1 Tax=Diphasiastrum complanatum TaxID=34168 RepID=A0ACC2AQD3_DIPCM|nr:hypothetical protein O6H91_20G026200 [Diphasiastrum complanatum]
MEDIEISKIDQELEINALRRVIGAYLDYSAAAVEDAQRWERSYSKLSPSHKAILPHLPKKYLQLRRCISKNAFFILNMLQVQGVEQILSSLIAYEPPFDMGYDGSWNNINSHDFETEQHEIENNDETLSRNLDSSNHSEAIDRPEYACSHAVANYPTESERMCWHEQDSNGHFLPSEAISNSVVTPSESQAIHGSSEDLQSGVESFQVGGHSDSLFRRVIHSNVPLADVDKVRCIVRNIVRDWAEEGKVERDQCYKPILEELQLAFPSRNGERPPTCLVPGAGLARLACEISRLGFMTQGNEFSYYMLICSSFILNHTQAPMEWAIHPWIHSNCNSRSDEDQLRPVRFPDLHPGSAGITDGFSMCAGDFVEVYSHPSQTEAWDAIVTCFFLDTAHNIAEYIEILSRVLKPGGVWINFGPLLYHFADAHSYSPEDEMSIELSLEDVKKIALHYGLKLKKEKIVETTYTANMLSMMQNRYFAAFWTMVKEK